VIIPWSVLGLIAPSYLCELSLAIERKKPIFPLRLEGDLWLPVRAFQSVDVTGGKLPPSRFFEAVRACLSKGIEAAESFLVQEIAAVEISTNPSSAIDFITTPAQKGNESTSGMLPTVPAAFPCLAITEFDVLKITGIEKGFLGLTQPKVATRRGRRRAEYFAEDLGNGVSLEMVRTLGGEFLMGSPESEEGSRHSERPQHRVMVPEFYMGKFPITQTQYEAVLGQNPSEFKGPQRPVENVSWQDAVAFCEVLSEQTGRGYRLPSEAEWEYACRAGTAGPFHFGETITSELANYNGNYSYGQGPKSNNRQQTTNVGQFPPNDFGLRDLHGNVQEWCQDVWHDNYHGAPANGSAWLDMVELERRVVRGGSWLVYPGYCRSACRGRVNPDARNRAIGFRVVCCASNPLL
jgi:formylglycine-generating enzyme required for sulfatase activity